MIPALLRFPVYTLDVSDRSYKYLLLQCRHSARTVSRFGEGSLPAGVVENGEIKQADVLISALRGFFIQNKIEFVGISLPEEKGFLKSIQMPLTMREDEIGSSLALQIEEHVPLPASEIVFDYILVGKDGDHFDVALRAFPRRIIESYVSVISKAGALPVLIEPELSAAVRAVVPPSYVGAGMLIDWGQTRTSFAIFRRGAVRFAATVPIGGFMVTQAIAKHMGISFEEADRFKQTNKQLAITKENIARDEVTQAIMPVIGALREEAERYILYWQGRSDFGSLPERIYLSGGDANIPGLPEYFSAELGVATTLANPWENISFPLFYLPELSKRDALRFVSTIGLSLQAAEEHQFL